MAREWITKDYMIAMCGIGNNSDVILTADKKTFYSVIKDVLNSNCVLTYPELFNQSEEYILAYKAEEVDNFLKGNKATENKKDKSQEKSLEEINTNMPM